jgi:spermidine synthase
VQARRSGRLGAHIGSTYAWNTIGNVLGAACTTLLLVPALGTLGAFHVCFGLNLIAGLGFLAVAGETSPARRLGPLAGAATVAAIYASVGTAWLDPVVLGCGHLRLRQRPAPGEAIDPTSSFAAWRDHYVVRPEASSAFFVTEDAHATVVVQGDPRQITLFVNGKPDASTGRDLPAQAFLAHLPLMLHPGARSLLVIGYGSGITVGSALRHPIEEVDVVEISRGVLEADALFAEANGAALRDPRVRVHLDDGQSFLRAAPRRYDLIISEPSNPWIAGISGLFTVEFFRAMRDRLNPGGVATIWFHEYEQERASVELVLRSVASVFPRVEVFRTHDYLDMILLASVDPMAPDFAAMEDRFDRPAVRDDLARIRITTLAGLLMHHTLPSARLAAAVPEGPVNSVWRDRLEHAAPRSFFEGVRSNFLTDFDALWQRRELEPDLLLARYRAHRQAAGAPLSREELLEAARSATGLGAPAHVAEALHALAEVAPPRPSEPARPARGGVADPATMGLFEAGYWAERLQAEGRQDEAAPFAERLRRLIEERAARDPRGFPGAGAP